MIAPAFLDELRGRTDLAALIGRTVKLQRSGREHKGCCPFHGEKTPSFYVYADHYHCFGCGAHGDGLRWLTDKGGLGFPDAVRELAALAGMEVPAPTPEARAKAERAATLRDATEAAATWFAEQLWGTDGGEARAYLVRRGVTRDTALAFGLGFAPDQRSRLRRALAAIGDPLLIEAGLLLQPDEGEPYDRFRGRLIFPIRDARGRAIGFGGRALGDGQPKYLNSPDTPLFDKGRTLWNLDRAAAPARAAGRLIVVEGYMDAIALAQAGVGEVVAPMGTALTEAQLALAWRLVPEPMLCFDGDKAGARAAGRAAERALAGLEPGRSLRFVSLPAGQDPDDVVRGGGAAAFEALLDNARPLNEALWDGAVAGADTATPEGRAALKTGLLALAGQIVQPDVRQQYEALFRERFWTDFGWRKPGQPVPIPTSARATPRRIEENAAAVLVGLMADPHVASDTADAVAAIPVGAPRLLRLRNAIVDAVMWHPEIDAAGLAARLAAEGLGEDAAWARRQARLAYSFTVAPGTDRARAQLLRLIAFLAGLEANYTQRRAANRAMRDGQQADADEQTLQSIAAPLSRQMLLLDAERKALVDTLYAFAEDAGPEPDPRPMAILPNTGETDGPDQDRDPDRARDEERRSRRAAARP